MMVDELNVDKIPEINPDVEKHLMHCLAIEVDTYINNIYGKRCLLCPFRRFKRLSQLKIHMKHHCKENMYLADGRSPQSAVVRAYYDYRQSIVPLVPFEKSCLGLLANTATMISEWNSKCCKSTLALLQRQNRPVLVRVLTHNGPEY